MKKATISELQQLAAQGNYPLAHVQAFVEVEAEGEGFLPDGRPKILFERHKFFEFTGGKHAQTHPHLCNAKAGGYATGKTALIRMEREWNRLAAAMELDRTAAIKATSWGIGQVMGFHWKDLGYASSQAFVNAMYAGEPEQLQAMFTYIRQRPALATAIRVGNWPEAAKRYNGVKYKINQYDIKLAAAASKFKRLS